MYFNRSIKTGYLYVSFSQICSEVCRNSISCSQPQKPCQKPDPALVSRFEEMRRNVQDNFRPVKPVETPIYPLIPVDDAQDIWEALSIFHENRIRDYEIERAAEAQELKI